MGRTIAVAVVGLLVSAPGAAGKTFTVTKKGDPAPGSCAPRDCSLREAVRAANNRPGGDVVVLPSRRGRYELSIEGAPGDEDLAASGDLDITGPLVIKHPRRGRATVDANEIDRVFEIFADAPTRFSKVKITGGHRETGSGDVGGGIHSFARLVLSRSAVVDNEAGTGGGLLVEGGTGVKLVRSTIARNVADDAGGLEIGPQTRIIRSKVVGNEATTGGQGGMYLYASDGKDALIDRTTIAGNRSRGDGGGIHYAGLGDSKLVVKRSTISDNRAESPLPTDPRGGGIFHNFGILRVTNSTVSGNSAEGPGGGIYGRDDTELNAATVVRNIVGVGDSSSVGGGLAGNDSSHFVVRNSLIALNRIEGGNPSDCNADEGDGTFDSAGHNLLSSAQSCQGFDQPGDIVRSNPKIGALKRNGGPTKTVALLRGSPAIGKAFRGSSPPRDQRNRKRDRRPDIGAFER